METTNEKKTQPLQMELLLEMLWEVLNSESEKTPGGDGMSALQTAQTALRAAAYARFSSEMQRDESVDAQLRAIRAYCEKKRAAAGA